MVLASVLFVLAGIAFAAKYQGDDQVCELLVLEELRKRHRLGEATRRLASEMRELAEDFCAVALDGFAPGAERLDPVPAVSINAA